MKFPNLLPCGMEGMVLIGYCKQDYKKLRERMHIPFVVYDGYMESPENIVNIEENHFDGGVFDWQEPEEWWPTIREYIPAYDKRTAPTNTMGTVAEMFRQWPGTLRSNHPARSVAAWGITHGI